MRPAPPAPVLAYETPVPRRRWTGRAVVVAAAAAVVLPLVWVGAMLGLAVLLEPSALTTDAANLVLLLSGVGLAAAMLSAAYWATDRAR